MADYKDNEIAPGLGTGNVDQSVTISNNTQASQLRLKNFFRESDLLTGNEYEEGKDNLQLDLRDPEDLEEFNKFYHSLPNSKNGVDVQHLRIRKSANSLIVFAYGSTMYESIFSAAVINAINDDGDERYGLVKDNEEFTDEQTLGLMTNSLSSLRVVEGRGGESSSARRYANIVSNHRFSQDTSLYVASLLDYVPTRIIQIEESTPELNQIPDVFAKRLIALGLLPDESQVSNLSFSAYETPHLKSAGYYNSPAERTKLGEINFQVKIPNLSEVLNGANLSFKIDVLERMGVGGIVFTIHRHDDYGIPEFTPEDYLTRVAQTPEIIRAREITEKMERTYSRLNRSNVNSTRNKLLDGINQILTIN
jgi:hypothetical protein